MRVIAPSAAKPRLLVAASGTGGHIFPALAVAQELTDWEITWLGVPKRLEQKLIPEHYPLVTVSVEGLQGKPSLAWLGTAAKLWQSFWVVRRLLQQQGFAGVFTTGGYIAAPALLAAKSLGLPALLHESNALPGKVTRVLARWTQGVGLGFAEAEDWLRGAETRWVGTPVRPEFFQPSPLRKLTLDSQASVLVIMGGSQGAQGINRLVTEAAPVWLAQGLQVVHLTGAKEFESCQQALQHPNYFPIPFWQDMAALLYRADLVIARSGAVSVAELCATGRASILIPFPFATDNHQTINAQTLVNRGAALMFPEKDLSAVVLTRTVLALIKDTAACQKMGEQARQLSRPQAATEMARWLREVMTPS